MIASIGVITMWFLNTQSKKHLKLEKHSNLQDKYFGEEDEKKDFTDLNSFLNRGVYCYHDEKYIIEKGVRFKEVKIEKFGR